LALARKRLHAALIADLYNRRYLSGFESTYALLVIDRVRATLITDGRYIESAEKQLPGWTVLCLPRTDVKSWWKRFWRACGYKTLGFEGNAAWNQVQNWKRQARPAKLVEFAGAVGSLRIVKDPGEITALRKAARLADQVMERTIDYLRPGMAEAHVSRHIRHLVDVVGAEGESFPNIVASGPNSSRPHHHPGERRLKKGDFVILDLGVIWKGYCSDITRTVALGSCSDRMGEVYTQCLRAQKAALKAVQNGAEARDPDSVARSVLAPAGLEDYFVHGLGHGVGLEIHEAPTLNARSEDQLRTGMAVTVEPGVYLPGEFGVRIEDLVIVGDKSPRILSRTPKTLHVLDV